MLVHTAQVRGRKIAWDKREVVQHGLNADRIKFDLDAEFRCCDSYQVVLCGPSLESPKRYIPDNDMTVAVPPSLMESTGPVSTCLLGYVGGEVRVVTAQERYPLVVVESGFTGPLDPGEEQPDLWAQIMSAEAARIEAELVREAAETARADAEAKRIAAEKARETASAEAVKAANEAAAKAEQAARQAEDRVTAAIAEVAEAEQARTEAEKARAAAESSRAEAEAARIAAESKRESAEAKRNADSAKAVADASAATSAANAAAGKADAAAQTATDGEASRVAAETARAKAEQARETAEAGRVEAEKVRVIADAERGERVDESVQKADAATAKATEAAGKATASATEADAAAKRADEAAKGASENVLVGTKTAGLVHVEDAWPTRLRECKVLGKSVQDGTPASDDPKPITSVGKAEVLVRGGNLVDVPDQVFQAYSNAVTDQSVLDEFERLPRDTPLVFSCTVEPLGPGDGEVALYDKDDGGGLVHLGTLRNNGVPLAIKRGKVKQVNLIGGLNQVGSRTIGRIQVAAAKSKYAAPVRLSATNIDLKGHELRSLPDGTRDELVIDASGNVVLRKRVGVTTGAEIAEKVQSVNQGSGLPYVMANVLPAFPSSISAFSRKVMSDRYVSAANTRERNCYRTWTSLMIVDDRFTSKEEARRILREENAMFLVHIPEQDIPIGRVDVPSLPASDSNVWSLGNILTDVSATYVRDVTLAFNTLESKLTQAIVATAANL